jgi:hypothetical protein
MVASYVIVDVLSLSRTGRHAEKALVRQHELLRYISDEL